MNRSLLQPLADSNLAPGLAIERLALFPRLGESAYVLASFTDQPCGTTY